MQDSIILTVQIDPDGIITIAEDHTSGAQYTHCKTAASIANAVKEYCEQYIEEM